MAARPLPQQTHRDSEIIDGPLSPYRYVLCWCPTETSVRLALDAPFSFFFFWKKKKKFQRIFCGGNQIFLICSRRKTLSTGWRRKLCKWTFIDLAEKKLKMISFIQFQRNLHKMSPMKMNREFFFGNLIFSFFGGRGDDKEGTTGKNHEQEKALNERLLATLSAPAAAFARVHGHDSFGLLARIDHPLGAPFIFFFFFFIRLLFTRCFFCVLFELLSEKTYPLAMQMSRPRPWRRNISPKIIPRRWNFRAIFFLKSKSNPLNQPITLV